MSTIDNNAATNATNASILNSLGVTMYGGSTPTTATTITGASTSDPSGRNTLGQEQFLKLITAQIQHQDPLNPTDNTQFVTQLAQIGALQSTQSMATSFSNFSNSMQSSMALLASSLVGHPVLVTGNQAELAPQLPIVGSVNLSQSTDNLTVNIYNQAGSLVKQLSLGSQAQGQVPFAWDGTLPDGTTAPQGFYNIKAMAQLDNKPAQMDTSVWANVNSVAINQANAANGQSGVTLNVAGLGALTMDKVQQIG